MTIQHILVPFDFSPYADRALAYAMALATKLQARVTLLHVLQTRMLAGGPLEIGPVMPSYIERLETDTRQALEAAAERVRQAGLACDTLVTVDVPFQAILDFANAHQVDLIVMGSHGRTGLQHMLLGSVAERVARLSACPVMVVRAQEQEAA